MEALASLLRRIGHDVVAMITLPEEAVDAAVEHDPDLCLLDVSFPGHGIDTVARIRATTRSKVLVLSAQCDDEAVCAALAAGAGGFVGKNQGIDDVVSSLDQVCAGKVIVPVETAPVPVDGPGRARPPELGALRFLTSREREALLMIAEGQSTKEIAQSMQVAYSTARTHVQNVLTKLGVRSRLQAAALVTRTGSVDQLDHGVAAGRALLGAASDNRRSCTPTKGGGVAARPAAQ
jgi:two-component system nitrate/nitrite response regulator NarL